MIRKSLLLIVIISLLVGISGATTYTDTVTPIMSSDTTPTGNSTLCSPSAYDSGTACWKAFNHDGSTTFYAAANSQNPAWVQINLSTSRTIANYTIWPRSDSTGPGTWALNASNDGVSWVTLNSQSGQTFSGTTPKSYPFANSNSYSRYRLVATSFYNSGSLNLGELYLYEIAGTAPVANFTASSNPSPTLANVTFTDISTNTPTSWLWQFGDGNTSTSQNPTYKFLAAGTYYVNLTATNAYGSSNMTHAQVVNNPSAPVANFTSSSNPSSSGNPVTFTDTSTGSPTSWDWIFGDGSANVTTQNPTHAYSTAGNYSVFLNASSAWGSNVTMKYHTVVNASGFNQQDIVMEPQFTLTIHITDSSTGAAIPVNTVTTSGGQSYTTTNGTAYFTVPYSIVVVYVASDGYYGASTSYVMDSDRDETIQLTKSRDEYYQPVTSLPKEVQFHVQTLFGSPIPNANVSVYGYITTTGNWDWVVTLLGMELDKAPINQSTMYGDTDINGDITFLMIPSTKYSITTTASGYSFTPMNIAVNDRTYTIVSDFNSTGWWGSGTNEQLDVNITVSKKVVNKTYGIINVTYNDPNLVTVGGNIHIYRPNTTRGGANVLVATMPITGNSFQNWTVVPINAITGADYIVQVEAVTST